MYSQDIQVLTQQVQTLTHIVSQQEQRYQKLINLFYKFVAIAVVIGLMFIVSTFNWVGDVHAEVKSTDVRLTEALENISRHLHKLSGNMDSIEAIFEAPEEELEAAFEKKIQNTSSALESMQKYLKQETSFSSKEKTPKEVLKTNEDAIEALKKEEQQEYAERYQETLIQTQKNSMFKDIKLLIKNMAMLSQTTSLAYQETDFVMTHIRHQQNNIVELAKQAQKLMQNPSYVYEGTNVYIMIKFDELKTEIAKIPEAEMKEGMYKAFAKVMDGAYMDLEKIYMNALENAGIPLTRLLVNTSLMLDNMSTLSLRFRQDSDMLRQYQGLGTVGQFLTLKNSLETSLKEVSGKLETLYTGALYVMPIMNTLMHRMMADMDVMAASMGSTMGRIGGAFPW